MPRGEEGDALFELRCPTRRVCVIRGRGRGLGRWLSCAGRLVGGRGGQIKERKDAKRNPFSHKYL